MTYEAGPPVADVLVIGAGNAGFCAAHAAAARGRSVLMVDAAPLEYAGGNSFFTAGATRVAHDGLAELLTVVEPDERHPRTEVPPYPAAEYEADMRRVTGDRNDPELTRVLAEDSFGTIRWLHDLGLRYRLMYERQAYRRSDGSYLFWGGLHLGNVNGGQGLIHDHFRAARRAGVQVRHGCRVDGLWMDNGRVIGAGAQLADGTRVTLPAESVVLAAGGFEANAALREQYLGSGWDRARVRGTPYNQGDLLQAALEAGAGRAGDWRSCHSVAWDAWNEENQSNRELTNRLTRQSYPLGIVVNTDGQRFVDEGADFRNYTYARYGREILAQPEALAFQVFDSAIRPMLRTEEYDMPGVSVVVADELAGLAGQAGIDADRFVRTVTEFNGSIDRRRPFNPNVKDGRAARTVPPKSNWASPIEQPPFFAYPVTCGITFTFGGLAADADGRVLDETGTPIPGLFVCGEMLGGLFSGNYPGGSGLTAGAVFGRRAGLQA